MTTKPTQNTILSLHFTLSPLLPFLYIPSLLALVDPSPFKSSLIHFNPKTMRIRNRPAPSIFPPPPDLNLNRSFPQPPNFNNVKPLIVQLRHDAASAASDRNARRARSRGDEDGVVLIDQFVANDSVVRRSSAKRSVASAFSADADDNDSTTIWKDESIGVQPSSYAKGTVSKEAAVKRGSKVGVANIEGSRCSRVNGRGWRCGQQTLVGYSLCEHHLGKSRLRSLSSVKNDTTGSTDNFAAAAALSRNKKKRLVEESDNDIDDEHEHEHEPLLISNGRKKSRIGTVKARSLSSLLGQTSQITNVVFK